jgi:hypothetical protein
MQGRAFDDALAACEHVAMDRALVTGRGPYAEGYRRAALDIASCIRRKVVNLPPTKLERHLRDAEIEARVLARVLRGAALIAAESEPGAHPIEALRALLLHFYKLEDLPPVLRVVPPRSETHLLEDDTDSAIVANSGA